MPRRLGLLILMVAIFRPAAAETPSFRTVRLHVEGLHHLPVAGREVDLVGLERWSIEPYSDSRNPYWHFTTDRSGDVIVRIGDFGGWLNEEQRPGWGVYALVVVAGPNDAGAVSERFWVDNAPQHQFDPSTMKWAPEWGPFRYLPGGGLNLKAELQEGFSFTGRIVDDQNPNKPLAGVAVNANADLHADTHTGMGGEILQRSTKTDREGRFIFQHLFPQTVYLQLVSPAIWLKTRVDGQWEDEVNDEIDPSGEKPVPFVEIGAALTPHFRYFGKVTDTNGKPLGGVKVNASCSEHPTPQTWEDNHNATESVSTRPDGTYELFTPTPWVNEIEAQGAKRNWSSGEEGGGGMLAPGRCDIQFDP